MSVAIEIAIEAEGWSAIPDLEGLIRRAVLASTAGALAGDPTELSILLCDDAAIRRLNRDFRGQDKATNVLSFPGAPPPMPGVPRLLGDIAVAWTTVSREADEEHKPIADHLSHLVVHGVLHLLGHDHEETAEAERMEASERRILAALDVPDPYAGADLIGMATP